MLKDLRVYSSLRGGISRRSPDIKCLPSIHKSLGPTPALQEEVLLHVWNTSNIIRCVKSILIKSMGLHLRSVSHVPVETYLTLWLVTSFQADWSLLASRLWTLEFPSLKDFLSTSAG